MRHLIALGAVAFACAVQAQTTVGLHLVSLHVPQRNYSNVTPGIYFRTQDGLTAGLLHNSDRRLGVYVGLTIDQEDGPFSLTGGVIYGYQRHPVDCKHIKVFDGYKRPHVQDFCGASNGSPGALAPMLTPSVRFKEVWGLTPRLAFVPPWFGGSAAFTFMIEKQL